MQAEADRATKADFLREILRSHGTQDDFFGIDTKGHFRGKAVIYKVCESITLN